MFYVLITDHGAVVGSIGSTRQLDQPIVWFLSFHDHHDHYTTFYDGERTVEGHCGVFLADQHHHQTYT